MVRLSDPSALSKPSNKTLEDSPWDIDTIVKVAGKFPELVYKCPQITRSVLSKHSIQSFRTPR